MFILPGSDSPSMEGAVVELTRAHNSHGVIGAARGHVPPCIIEQMHVHDPRGAVEHGPCSVIETTRGHGSRTSY